MYVSTSLCSLATRVTWRNFSTVLMSSGYNKRNRSDSSSEEGNQIKRSRTDKDNQATSKKRPLETLEYSEPSLKKQKMKVSLNQSGRNNGQPKKLNISLKGLAVLEFDKLTS